VMRRPRMMGELRAAALFAPSSRFQISFRFPTVEGEISLSSG